MAKIGRPKKDEKDKVKYHLVAVRLEDYTAFKKTFDNHPLTADKKIADVLGSLMRGYAEKMEGHKDWHDIIHGRLEREGEIKEALVRHELEPWEITVHTINSYSRVHPEMSFDAIIEENIDAIRDSQKRTKTSE